MIVSPDPLFLGLGIASEFSRPPGDIILACRICRKLKIKGFKHSILA